MTYEEQQIRLQTILKAQEMFPDERNITTALQLYKDATGDPIPLFITTKDADRPLTVMDNYERIPCSECGSDMLFRIVPENDEGYHTQLVCSNSECDTVLNSEYTLQDWMKVLKKVA